MTTNEVSDLGVVYLGTRDDVRLLRQQVAKIEKAVCESGGESDKIPGLRAELNELLTDFATKFLAITKGYRNNT